MYAVIYAYGVAMGGDFGHLEARNYESHFCALAIVLFC